MHETRIIPIRRHRIIPTSGCGMYLVPINCKQFPETPGPDLINLGYMHRRTTSNSKLCPREAVSLSVIMGEREAVTLQKMHNHRKWAHAI